MELFSNRFFCPPADIKYHGLKNQGATCYLNSVLQVLFMTKDFREAVERYTCGNPDTARMDSHLKDLFDDLKERTAYTYNIKKRLGISRVGEQRDAAEYFEKIVTHTSREASQVFEGVLTHKYTCTGCGTEINTDGPFWSLPLVLVDSDSEGFSVMDGIDRFLRASDICGDEQLYCDQCDAKTDANVRYVIKHHPEVLTLLLKRFKFDDHRMEHVKINCSVEVPYTLQIPESQTYDLYAFVDHFGDLRGGHYTATIKSQEDERWYNFNDTTVTPLRYPPFQVHDNKKRSQSAYLLFYRKKKMHAADASTQDVQVVERPHSLKLNDASSPKSQKHSNKKTCSSQWESGLRFLDRTVRHRYFVPFVMFVFFFTVVYCS
ncbi:ubiquitin carboxyl-terminal hydrolase 2-like isoform X2 [Seriola aureovittata]|uniref:ubiquitin carboxyl-terminal hydrolase 2-like isoform X2 n=1 Tax=Seriola aureovittata TaxID=2871759 RepID=UPI0024BE9429|nr:ubiquitin carboxyl-terminal hydrolase 2-like isoform X2 [Seriola aureovittata]XP_056225593.1 ubiquitin carboxyl-terminal hydrolase 2-like isoform X2 [Seriola aureovittata]XP_056225594.1 ubiquitin carboxyl-terminal hydrolase 2-like isoform X2 [Seriola aureovittata]